MRLGLKASVVRYAADAVLESHFHDVDGVSLVLAGSLVEQARGREEAGGLGSVVFKPGGLAHRNRIGPRGAILLAVQGEATSTLAASGWRWTSSTRATALGLRVAAALKEGCRARAEEELLRLLDLLAARDPAPQRLSSALLERVRERLEDEMPPPGVGALAWQAGVHPVYLTRAFRERFGCSISHYRRRVRIRRAASLLAATDLPISAIAATLDFFDQSHLCRLFRAELSLPPSEYRALFR